MNAYAQKSAYGQIHHMTVRGRDAEAEALIKAARQMDDALRHPDDLTARKNALQFNLKLWTAFQADLAEPDHPMSEDLREKMLSLSVFVDKQTAVAMGSKTPAPLKALIEINRNIGQGLMTMNRCRGAA